MVSKDQNIRNDLYELVLRFSKFKIFSILISFKGTNDFLSNNKENTDSQCYDVDIEIYKVLSLYINNEIIRGRVLSDHVFDILV